MTCKRCNSYAINHHCHGRDGSGEDLCDVCYWRNIAEKHDNKSFQDQLIEAQKRIIELENEINVKHTHHVVRKLKNELNAANERIKRMEEFINRFFDPEDLGYVVSTVVRDDARQSLGMKRVESGSRISMI